MNDKHLDFSPLANYSLIFKSLVILKRAWMITVRVIIIGLLLYVAIVILRTGNFSSRGTYNFNFSIGWLLAFWFGSFYALMMSMNSAWNKFASQNGFTVVKHARNFRDPYSPVGRMRVPSFRGKLLKISLFPIIGQYVNWNFGFFTRQYKEGGFIRWRERKMDTVLWIELPKELPHIVIDSRYNERARKSNLSRHYNSSQLLHFEGSTGDKYNVFAAKGNHIAVLQLFTPDVLEKFFAYLPYVDIEVRGKTLWFVWRYAVLDNQVAAALFAGVREFMTEFDKQLSTASFSDQNLNAAID